ncbi:cysteine dioxygenase family protein [Paraburkholderia phenoliruptrix]|uniref:Cysteine dioxygenase type I n=2 Tax=Paraburkholderia phenoliruptrix TaxID=252970 RepID=K0DVP0_9BURK|nr:cysteine dioxygenase [Paraburkholderia phenoliruptrix]AFT90231.1 Cysteine dioxygenase type I [Paraburkholderia phenoliruptrix BR3459a]CAB4052615.1 3-mercaptopropionate dioxygenase [Paraburkholderia phenoliruptrix]
MRVPATPFNQFVHEFTLLVDTFPDDEAQILGKGHDLLAGIVRRDDWLPEAYAQPHPQYYQQYLLHADPADRFSVVSFVWGPGQKTPIHNHTVWALIGLLRGGERSECFQVGEPGQPMRSLGVDYLKPGTVESISPRTCDIHRVSNTYDDRVSISVHVYGGNIGRISRHVFDPQTSMRKPFISGYSNEAEISA